MGKKYLNPPIIEAVCEFRFTADTEWDITIPGLFYEQVRDEFPRKEKRILPTMEFKNDPGGEVTQEIQMAELAIFRSNDRQAFFQIGGRLLSANVLAPYPTWEIFFSQIQKGYSAINKVIDNAKIDQIALRYINRINIPITKEIVNIEDYFDFHPHIGSNLPHQPKGFITGCIFSYHADRDNCKLQISSTKSDRQDQMAFILDIAYGLKVPGSIKSEEAIAWVTNAHGEVEKLFEGCLMPDLRETFQEKD